MSIKGLKSLLAPFLVILLFAGCWIGLVIYQTSKHFLPHHVDTLAKFAAEMPEPDKVIVFEKEGFSYVEVVGPRPNFPAVPSGPPAYIFDSSGTISWWTHDVGDTTEYWEKWQNRSNSRELSMQEAMKFVHGAKQ